MKIKTQFSNIIAVLTLFALVSGFQLNSTDFSSALNSSEEIVYAGPCNDNGCVGGDDQCMIVKILWGAFHRTCFTTAPEELQEL